MSLEIDHDVACVLTFMQRNFRAQKLRQIAHAVADLSDLIWQRHEGPAAHLEDKIRPLRWIGSDDQPQDKLTPT